MIRHRFTDRLLHRLALQSRGFRRFYFARECERNGRRFDRHRAHVFIVGVARSGSTALLNRLYASGAFATTRYAHMPFVLAPSLARVVSGLSSRRADPVERRHGDSLQVGPDSPEALDGIFWNTYLPARDDPLRPRNPPQALLENYAMFIENLLCHEQQTRYLSKMNQGIALLPGLASWFDCARFLVPFREPLQQAASLLQQHRRFARLDAYETRYLEWLEHREFGATHRPFSASGDLSRRNTTPLHIDYWLEQWLEGYAFIAGLAAAQNNILPLQYERLAASTDAWQVLGQRLDVELDGSSFVNRNDDTRHDDDADPVLLDKCRALYRQLANPGGDVPC